MSDNREPLTVSESSRYDIRVIRPPMRDEDFALRGRDMPPARRKAIRQALRTLHNLETMAVNIYRYQITREPSEHNRQLVAAMCNEMTHLQDFQVKLFEFGFRPSLLRTAYAVLGWGFGFFSHVKGRLAVLRTGVWVETKAVHHYAELLSNVEWDDDTRRVVEKNQADEDGHVRRWMALLENRQP